MPEYTTLTHGEEFEFKTADVQRFFAELDQNNNVIQVVIVGKKDLVDEQGNLLEFPESEPVGIKFLNSIHKPTEYGPRIWKQTSYRYIVGTYPLQAEYRGQPARVGGKYDPVNDVFTFDE
jgi:hypothetical protein